MRSHWIRFDESDLRVARPLALRSAARLRGAHDRAGDAEGSAVTRVHHDADDHGWQFHGAGEAWPADAMIVALAEVCRHDPTVAEVAVLPPGWVATRSRVGGPWARALDR